MAEEIKNNLVFLTQSLTNLPLVLLHCVQHNIFSMYEEEHIMAGETTFDKNRRFFAALMMKNWEDVRIIIIKILRETSNSHCADKIECIKTPHQKREMSDEMLSVERYSTNQISGNNKTRKIFASKWWPRAKRLPLGFLERKQNGNKLVYILKEHLMKSKNQSTVINQGATVSGMGGVGKTTIAKWFAIQFQDSYDHIIWIDSGEKNLQVSFIELAKKLKVDTTLTRLESLAVECFAVLEEAKCLFIFDNAECYAGPEGIRSVLPEHENFHTIITSRTKGWGNEAGDGKIPEMHLNVFSLVDSVEFLMKNLESKRYTENQLEILSDLLGNLPLALQIAVSTIKTNKLSLQEYVRMILETDVVIDETFEDYQRSINKTMKISLDVIKNHESDFKQSAHNILIIFGYIKPDFVEFTFFQAVEKLSVSETKKAMILLEKYSLINIDSKWGEKQESCSIHRLLQQVIRYHAKENEKAILKKILDVEGFLEYLMEPYLYAYDEQTPIMFPKLTALLFYPSYLKDLIRNGDYSEAVAVSQRIYATSKTPIAVYNYAFCLQKADKLDEAASVLKSLNKYLQNKSSDIDKFDNDLKTLVDRINLGMDYYGLWDPAVEIAPKIVSGLLFLVYIGLGMENFAHEIINNDSQLITNKTPQSLDSVMRFLKSRNILNYRFSNNNKCTLLKLGSDLFGREISLEDCRLNEEFPNDLNELILNKVEMLNGEGQTLKSYDISSCISTNLNRLRINCVDCSTKFAIQFEKCQSYHSITLENCIILLQNGKRITSTEIDLRGVTFIENGKEIEVFCLNDLIDFQQTKKLILFGNNMLVTFDDTLELDFMYLEGFKNIAVRVKELCLCKCSIPLESLFILSQSATEMDMNQVTVEIDNFSMEGETGICSEIVTLKGLKYIHDSVEVNEILLNKILDFTKIKRITVENYRDTSMTFDLNQQFSIDYLNLKGVKLINWDNSSSSVKTLWLEKFNIQNVLICQFRVTETLGISWDSVVDATSLDSITAAANKLELSYASVNLDTNLNPNKSHYINGPVKEIRIEGITFLKGGEKIDNFLVNEFINISQLNSLILTSSEKQRNHIILDMENVSLALDKLELHGVPVLNWDKGDGLVNNMVLIDLPFHKRNNIKINSLQFQRNSVDLSCLPENIQRIELGQIYMGDIDVICDNCVTFNDLNCVMVCRPQELKYFANCPNLHKVKLNYTAEDKEFLHVLQCIPKNVKTMKIEWGDGFTPFCDPPALIITGTRSPLVLETLMFVNFPLFSIQSALKVLKPQNIVVYDHMKLNKAQATIVINLIESYKSVVIGKFQWDTIEHFQSCPLSNFVDGKGKFYIFENQRGRVIQKPEFKKMLSL